jgi:hypothetical protein
MAAPLTLPEATPAEARESPPTLSHGASGRTAAGQSLDANAITAAAVAAIRHRHTRTMNADERRDFPGAGGRSRRVERILERWHRQG